MDLYNVTFSERADRVFVTLIDRNVDPQKNRSLRGNPGKIPGFEVELDRNSKKVVKSYFMR